MKLSSELEYKQMAKTAVNIQSERATFERLQLPNALIEFMVSGSGDPVLFTHGGLLSDVAVPLVNQKVLSGYQLIGYRRRGYAVSDLTIAPEGTTIVDMAADMAALLDHLSLDRAHIVGHSMGGLVSLQFAHDYPERVATLSLLEPPIGTPETTAVSLPDVVLAPLAFYEAEDKEAAVNHSLVTVSGQDWRKITTATVPNGVELALSHADTFYQRDGKAVLGFTFGPEEAARVKAPVLSMIGTEGHDKIYREGRELFHKWFDDVEDFDVVGCNHLLPIHDPAGVAYGLADFLHRHSL